MSGYRLGPIGALREIPPIAQAGTPVTNERASSSWTTLGGRRIVQRAPRALRTWSLNLGQWRAPADVAYLTALASGAVPGPLYLYTEVAAQTNLLPADIAAPGAMGTSGLRTSVGSQPPRGRVSAIVGGAMTSLVGAHMEAAADGQWSETIPLPHGSYVLSCWSSGAASSCIKFRTVDVAGDPVATGSVSTTAHSTSFYGASTVTVASAAVGVQVRLGQNVDPQIAVGALRLISWSGLEAPDPEWLNGEGVPQVVIDDPEQTIQLVTAGRIAADYSITLREVG